MKNLVLILAVFFYYGTATAQSDSSIVSQRALVFADSLLRSFHQPDLTSYTNLSYPGVVQYYGGKKNFQEFVSRSKAILHHDSHEQVEMMQLLQDAHEWQCVIRKTAETTVDSRQAAIITYMVGQSVDNGESWKFFDVASNPVNNISYIMPDIFGSLTIPQREVVFFHTTSQAIYQQDPIQPAHL